MNKNAQPQHSKSATRETENSVPMETAQKDSNILTLKLIWSCVSLWGPSHVTAQAVNLRNIYQKTEILPFTQWCFIGPLSFDVIALQLIFWSAALTHPLSAQTPQQSQYIPSPATISASHTLQ